MSPCFTILNSPLTSRAAKLRERERPFDSFFVGHVLKKPPEISPRYESFPLAARSGLSGNAVQQYLQSAAMAKCYFECSKLTSWSRTREIWERLGMLLSNITNRLLPEQNQSTETRAKSVTLVGIVAVHSMQSNCQKVKGCNLKPRFVPINSYETPLAS